MTAPDHATQEHDELDPNTLATIDARAQELRGIREEARFETWHKAWVHLDTAQRRAMLQVIAKTDNLTLSDEDIDLMQWIKPRSVGVHPDGVLIYGDGADPRVWAVLEYKTPTAKLNSPLRWRVLGLTRSEADATLPDDVDLHIDHSAYRRPGYGWRVPQLVAYYHARSRTLRFYPTDDNTLWRVLAPALWMAGSDGYCPVPDQHERHTVPPEAADERILEIPDVWRCVDVAEPLAVFRDALREQTEPGDLRTALVNAIAAIAAPPGKRA